MQLCVGWILDDPYIYHKWCATDLVQTRKGCKVVLENCTQLTCKADGTLPVLKPQWTNSQSSNTHQASLWKAGEWLAEDERSQDLTWAWWLSSCCPKLCNDRLLWKKAKQFPAILFSIWETWVLFGFETKRNETTNIIERKLRTRQRSLWKRMRNCTEPEISWASVLLMMFRGRIRMLARPQAIIKKS